MTDKIKKLALPPANQVPEFSVMPRGGYVEDVVDRWLDTHLAEVRAIIEYQNHCVDIVEELEAQLDEANGRINEVSNADVQSELDLERQYRAAAEARVAELEAELSARPEEGSLEADTAKASVLLQQATQLGANFIEQAKVDAVQIRADAEQRLADLREEINEFEALRFATANSLHDFFSTELNKLNSHPFFSSATLTEEVDPEAVVEGEDVSVEEALQAEPEEVVVGEVTSEDTLEEDVVSEENPEAAETVEFEELSEEVDETADSDDK